MKNRVHWKAAGCFVIFATSSICLGATSTTAESEKKTATMKYPETRRVDHVDEYHGVKVADPYRWLESDVRESEDVAAWVKEENDIARKYLDAIPQRSAIVKRLTELWNYERYSPPPEPVAVRRQEEHRPRHRDRSELCQAAHQQLQHNGPDDRPQV
jgi:protease II